MKTCSKCKVEKNNLEFYKDKKRKDKLWMKCKMCCNIQHYKWIKDNKIKNKEYNKEYILKYRRSNPVKYHLSIIKKRGDCKIKYNVFETWYKLQPEKCYYCDIPKNLIINLKWGYEYTWSNKPTILFLTIDRKNSEKGYCLSNICLCCSVCNSLKSNFFSEEEFIRIAKEYIKPKWNKKKLLSIVQ